MTKTSDPLNSEKTSNQVPLAKISPEKKNSKQIHWHVEVYPQTTPWSGLELGFGIFLNELTPEKAAEELGAACRKELSALVGIL